MKHHQELVSMFETLLYTDNSFSIDLFMCKQMIQRLNCFDKQIEFRSTKKYLFQWFLDGSIVGSIIDNHHSNDEFLVADFYSFLFNQTPAFVSDKYNHTFRCHWLAQCTVLKEYSIHKRITPTRAELCIQDYSGNTPLHIALLHNNQPLAHLFSFSTPCWIRNKKGQSILTLYAKKGNQNRIKKYYTPFLAQLQTKYSMNRYLIEKIASKLVLH